MRNDKAQDYHDILSTMFKGMKQIHDSSRIWLTLDVGPTKRYDVVAIPFIQFIIGDFKGNNLICDR